MAVIAMMVIAVLASTGVNGALLGASKCSYGPSYWCDSFENAKTCSTTKFCLENVWLKVPSVKVQVKDNSACTFCKDIIHDIRAFIADNQTEATIVEYLNKACDYMPDDYAVSECKKIEQHYLDEFLAMAESTLDAESICTNVHLCVEQSKSQRLISASGDLKQASASIYKHSMKMNAKPTAADPLCDACKTGEAFIKAQIDDKDNQAMAEEMIIQECQKVGGNLAECTNLTKEILPQIVSFADSYLDGQLCQLLHLCSSDATKLSQLRFNTAFRQVLLPKIARLLLKSRTTVLRAKDQDYCTDCEELFNYLKIVMNNNETETEVMSFIEGTLCSQMGEFSSVCKETVEQYFPQVWAELLAVLDPKTICAELGLCTDTAHTTDVSSEAKVATLKSTASVQCILCEFVVEKLESLIDTNATEAEVIAAVEKVCSIMPSSVRTECDKFISKYGPAIIKLLMSEASPGTICSLIGLCDVKQAYSSVTGSSTKLGSENCVMCEMAVGYLKSSLAKNATVQQLVQAMMKLCKKLPTDLSQECDAMVSEFAGKIIEILDKDMDAQTICTEIGMCAASIVSAPKLPPADGLVHLYKKSRDSNV